MRSWVLCAGVVASSFVIASCDSKVSEADGSAIPVYLVLGQSNAVGMRSKQDLLPDGMKAENKNVLFLKDGKLVPISPYVTEPEGFGPEISFAYEMSKQKKIGIIKVAAGNTTLEKQWNPETNGELYKKTLSDISSFNKLAKIKVSGVIWMQGESDGYTYEAASKYKYRLEKLISNLKMETGNDSMTFSVCRVNSPEKDFPYTSEVRKAQEAVNSAGYRWFDCDGLTKGSDGVHYDTKGVITLGELFAKSISK